MSRSEGTVRTVRDQRIWCQNFINIGPRTTELAILRILAHLFCVTYCARRYAKNIGAIQILGQFRAFDEILAVRTRTIAEKSALEA